MSRSPLTLLVTAAMACTAAACADSTITAPGVVPHDVAFAKAPTAAATGGGGGGARLEMSTGVGLYIDPVPAGSPGSAAGKTVQGYVVVTYGHPSGGNTSFGTPPSTTVTLNGVPLVRMPNTNGSFFYVNPAGPQPVVAPGRPLALVAQVPASPGIAAVTRTLTLPCPSDIAVTATPAPGSSLAGVAAVHVTSSANLVFNPTLGQPNGLPASLLGGMSPNAILFGYDLSTHAVSTQSAEALLGFAFTTKGFDFTLPVGTPAAGNGYLTQLTWPGTYLLDGNSGGFCGMTKHWTYTI